MLMEVANLLSVTRVGGRWGGECRRTWFLCGKGPARAVGAPIQSFVASAMLSDASSLRIAKTTRRQQAERVPVSARVRDPDAAEEDEENPDKEPPNIFWRTMAAFMYMIPWIDAVGLGREIYHKFPVFIYLYYMTGPFVGIYYCSQFAPLVVFFLMFLAVVKNNKLSHFVRFNCMQAIMLDIVVMLFTILHSYFPAELRWSWVLSVFDSFSWVASMATVLYCVFFTLRGFYADLPYVSEAVYIQVEMSEYA
eukprot:evm.model.scf_337.2 EVM.evm.TU.scf_337.2   scf_337:8310-12018(+)